MAMKPMAYRMRKEEGSAFIISILVLFVLSVLGLALMLTTTTEKDIAINYRWGGQAFFKPAATGAAATQPWMTGPPEGGGPCDPQTAGCRDYQYYIDQCPNAGGGPCTRIFIGKVLLRQDGTPAQWDFRAPGAVVGDLDNDGATDIEGTFTLWVRRPTVGSRDYGSLAGEEDRVILTAEGTAPNAMGAGAGKPVSLRRLEISIRLPGAGVEGGKYDSSENPHDDSTP